MERKSCTVPLGKQVKSRNNRHPKWWRQRLSLSLNSTRPPPRRALLIAAPARRSSHAGVLLFGELQLRQRFDDLATVRRREGLTEADDGIQRGLRAVLVDGVRIYLNADCIPRKSFLRMYRSSEIFIVVIIIISKIKK